MSYSRYPLPWHGLLRVWDVGLQVLPEACLSREVNCHTGNATPNLAGEDFVGGEEGGHGELGAGWQYEFGVAVRGV